MALAGRGRRRAWITNIEFINEQADSAIRPPRTRPESTAHDAAHDSQPPDARQRRSQRPFLKTPMMNPTMREAQMTISIAAFDISANMRSSL